MDTERAPLPDPASSPDRPPDSIPAPDAGPSSDPLPGAPPEPETAPAPAARVGLLDRLVPSASTAAVAALPEGGRLPIVQMILALLGFIAAEAIGGTMGGVIGTAWSEGLGHVVAAALAALAYWLVTRFFARRAPLEFSGPGAGRELLGGLVLGALLMSLIVAGVWIGGAYHVSGAGWNPLVLDTLALSVMAGVAEEIVFRGFAFRLIEHRFGSWWALAVTSLIFGAAHLLNPEASPWGAIAIVLEAGFLLGACYMATRRLWFVIGVHIAWNFFQGGIYGSDISGTGSEGTGLLRATFEGPEWLTGGNMGLEGSLLAVLVGLAAAVLLLLVAERRGLIVPLGAFRRSSRMKAA